MSLLQQPRTDVPALGVARDRGGLAVFRAPDEPQFVPDAVFRRLGGSLDHFALKPIRIERPFLERSLWLLGSRADFAGVRPGLLFAIAHATVQERRSWLLGFAFLAGVVGLLGA